jgi:cation/acetate symporter
MIAMAVLLILSATMYFGNNPFNILIASGDTVSPVVAQDVAKGIMSAQNDITPQALIEAVRAEMTDAPTAMTPGVAVPGILNQLSLVLGLLFGVLGLPHILIRFYTVKDSKTAQKSAAATIIGLAIFYAMVLFVGLAAMSLLYPDLINLLIAGERGKATNMTVPMFGELLGGEIFMGIIAAGAMAAMISTSVGLLISMTTSLAHDVYAGILRPESSEKERLFFAKCGAAVLTVIAILASIWLKDQNVAVLVGMCFGIASSTFAPVLVAAVWWKRLTKAGVIAAMSTGLVVSLTFTFARFLKEDSVFGLPVLVNPALYGVIAALTALIVISYLTKNVGRAEEVLAIAHK